MSIQLQVEAVVALSGDTVTFEWSEGAENVVNWVLMVGTSTGSSDLYHSGRLNGSTLSAIVTGLPTDSSQVHVRLRYKIQGSVSETDYTYTAAGP
jgi:hypothetical protein